MAVFPFIFVMFAMCYATIRMVREDEQLKLPVMAPVKTDTPEKELTRVQPETVFKPER